MEADGGALLYRGSIVSSGTVPSQSGLYALMNSVLLEEKITVTANIERDYPGLVASLGGQIAGLLVAKLQNDCTFAFFRKARDRNVEWAGTPDKHITVEDGQARLHPRGSFNAYPV